MRRAGALLLVPMLFLAAVAVQAAHAQQSSRHTGTQALASSWTAPLSTRGRYIVDATGERFKLKAGNWHGASGTWTGSGDRADPANHHYGEKSFQIPLGLDRAPIDEIIAGFHRLGLNAIRLPFSNQMIHDQRAVPDRAVAANPRLRGKTRLEVFDAVIEALTSEGFAVILNNHTTTSRWCCGLDGNERWNTSQTEAQWESDWLFMVRRYADNERVVGADLYNEVRRNALHDPTWGAGGNRDWQRASQELADRILTEANPDMLVVIEGLNWTGVPVDQLPHARPMLKPVRNLSHTLVRSNKLVYSAHVYGFIGPHHVGASGVGETHDPRFRDMSRAQLFNALDRLLGYVSTQGGKHFTAPVWVGEFGVKGRGQSNPKSKRWFRNFVDYLVSRDLGFAYWPLTGWDGSGNNWALLNWNARGELAGLYRGDDWRAPVWTRLVDAEGKTGGVSARASWSMLNLDHADFIQSLRMRSESDWDRGARKGVCPDGQRLVGLSHTGNRGLCTSANAGSLWEQGGGYRVVRGESHVDNDWAPGYTKLECPDGYFVSGYAVRGADVSSVLCARSGAELGANGRVVWFNDGDNRPAGARGGDFAHGHYKGQCDSGEYVAGVAYSGRWSSPVRNPDALLCKDLS